MKPYYALFFWCLFVSNINAQVVTNVSWVEKSSLNAADVIYYNANKKLVWENFMGVPNKPNPVVAITSSGFGYNVDMHTSNGKGQINVAVYCYFSKPKSWVKAGKNTAYTLTHEQHHFDATYIAAKLFIEKIREAKLTTSNMNAVLTKLYNNSCSIMNKMQNDYDSETMNGQLKAKQEKWNSFFDETLIRLKN
jgi:hypothetical protein